MWTARFFYSMIDIDRVINGRYSHKSRRLQTYIRQGSRRKGEPVEERQFHACMKRVKAGDKSALREIYEAYVGYIYSVVFQVVLNKEDTEDVTSEFFIKLWKLADTYRSGRGHRAWLAVIARNMAIDLLRKKKREVLTEDFEDSAAESVSEADVEGEVLSDMSLKAAMDTLKPPEREVVNMKIMGELTFQEIADILGQPLGTVTWRYQNAIRKLRRCGYE